MKLLLIAAPILALGLLPAPALAEYPAAFSAHPGQFDQFGALPRVHRDPGLSGKRHHRGPPIPGIVVLGGPGYYGGEWALYNNRGWEPDSFNDWWHDRPERAYPRWVQNNQNCDRMWWGGGVWRCAW